MPCLSLADAYFYRYTAPKLAIANLYWKGWILLAIVASLNPSSIGKSKLTCSVLVCRDHFATYRLAKAGLVTLCIMHAQEALLLNIADI